MKRRASVGYIAILFILIALSLCMILPLIRVFSLSFSSRYYVEGKKVLLLPKGLTLDSYRHALSEIALWRSLGVNVIVTLTGTLLAMCLTVLMAYPLSRKEFMPRRGIMIFVLITMIFQAPVIPFFLTVKTLGMLDTLWSLIIPPVLNAFNLIIVRTFLLETPEELIDSAKMDGCGDLRTLMNVVLPISLPVVATVSLFYAVMYWNIFYYPLMFIYNKNLRPLQILVRSYIIGDILDAGTYVDVNYNNTTLQMATIIFATAPILAVYPFLQKYFVQGATLGAIKE